MKKFFIIIYVGPCDQNVKPSALDQSQVLQKLEKDIEIACFPHVLGFRCGYLTAVKFK